MKIYLNDKQKYSGEIYDILDDKLYIFYDFYGKASI